MPDTTTTSTATGATPLDSGVRFERSADGRRLEVILDRPAKKNAISPDMARRMQAALEDAVASGAHAVVFRSAVDGVFSAGFDIGAMNAGDGADPAAALYELYDCIEHLPAVTIASVDGLAVGGGVELFLCCDVRLATRRATFRVPPARLSIVYERTGIARFLRRIGQALTSELFLTGRAIDAETAERCGLATRIADADAWTSSAQDVLDGAPLAIRAMKNIIDSLSIAAPMSASDEARFVAERDHVKRSQDHREALDAFRERRKPRFRGE